MVRLVPEQMEHAIACSSKFPESLPVASSSLSTFTCLHEHEIEAKQAVPFRTGIKGMQ